MPDGHRGPVIQEPLFSRLWNERPHSGRSSTLAGVAHAHCFGGHRHLLFKTAFSPPRTLVDWGQGSPWTGKDPVVSILGEVQASFSLGFGCDSSGFGHTMEVKGVLKSRFDPGIGLGLVPALDQKAQDQASTAAGEVGALIGGMSLSAYWCSSFDLGVHMSLALSFFLRLGVWLLLTGDLSFFSIS